MKKQKRYIKINAAVLVLAVLVAIMTGCTEQVSSSSVSDSPSDAVTFEPVITPIPTTAPQATPNIIDAEDEDAQAVEYNDWIYYLDVNDPIVTNYSEDPPLHMKKKDGSNDTDLGIRGFTFEIIGDYIYVDSNDPDLDENGTQTWGTTRMNTDGSEKKKLEYGSMSARLIPEGEQKFYFTTMGDSAIYISGFSCENVETLLITLPDKSEIENKLGTDKLLQLNIEEINGGAIVFGVSVSASQGTLLYSGTYKTTADGSVTEKTEGTYYTYGSAENE